MKTYPLLQSQLGIFMEWIKNPSVTQYNLPICSKLPKVVDIKRIQVAITRIIQERSVLRTRFVMENGEPRQYADDQMAIPVTIRNMSDKTMSSYAPTIC